MNKLALLRAVAELVSRQAYKTVNVKDFVRETLEQLGAGVAGARSKPGISISPQPYLRDDTSNTAGDRLIDRSSQTIIESVDFDLSVVVRSQIAGEAHAKLEVLSLDLGGGKLDASLDHTRVHRVRFRVPVSFPGHTQA